MIFATSLNLPDWLRNLPVGHLQLRPRARRTASRYASIGQLVDVIARSEYDKKLQKSVAGEISAVLGNLGDCLNRERENGWFEFCRSRTQAEYNSLYFASPLFDRLSAASTALLLDKLHLKRRGLNALANCGIKDLGGLIGAAKLGIVHLPLAGRSTIREIQQSLWAVMQSINAQGEIDWIKYSELRGFDVLPRKSSSGSLDEFLAGFPRLCKRAILRRFGPSGVTVLRQRLFQRCEDFESFENIGSQLSCNRETVRLMEGRIVALLRGAVFDYSHAGCSFQFRPEFLKPFKSLAAAIADRASNLISRATWSEILNRAWNVSRQEIQSQEVLLLRLLGFGTFTAEHVTVPRTDDSRWKRSGAAVAELRKLLRMHGAKWLTRDEISQHLGQLKLIASPADVDPLVSLIESAECDPSRQRFRTRFEFLPNRVEKCERLLREHGKKLHYKRLAVLIAEHQGPVQQAQAELGRVISATLSGSPRFRSVGKTGEWILTEWKHIEWRTIVEIAEELLEQSGRPLTSRSLCAAIGQRRPVRPSSIGTLLRKDSRFVRTAPETWALRKQCG